MEPSFFLFFFYIYSNICMGEEVSLHMHQLRDPRHLKKPWEEIRLLNRRLVQEWEINSVIKWWNHYGVF